jgi:glycogen(starch) synthase
MHIAIISYEFPPDTGGGGIGTYSREVARLLCESGHLVEVFAASNVRKGWIQEEGYRVNFVSGSSKLTFAKEVVSPFSERHATVKFDVVEGPEYGADGREVLSTFPLVPHVVKLHTPSELVRHANHCRLQPIGWMRHRSGQMRKALEDLVRGDRTFSITNPGNEVNERAYAEQCDQVVSPSRALLDWAMENWSVSADQTMVVPNPYRPSEEMLKIPIRARGMCVGFMGRLEYRKGVQDLVEAIPHVLHAEPSATFRFVGEPVLHPGTREMFDRYIRRKLGQFGDRITIAKPRPLTQMYLEYAAVDVCAFPSIWENFPNVCLEAMASARAVVGSEAGGMSEMLGEGCGMLIPPRSPKRLAEAIVEFLRSPELRFSAGLMARRRVLERYSRSVLPMVEQSYQRAIRLSLAKQKLKPRHASFSTLAETV